MDIYSFIRSKDVATHCCNIGKTWNTLEMAVIIDRSKRTIADKHAAWQELIEHYPDMPAMPNYHKVQFDSVHKVIAERIVYERLAIARFKEPENGVFYTYSLETWGFGSEPHPFSTFEKAFADLKDSYTQNEASRTQFKRVIVDINDCQIHANCDGDGTLYSIGAYANDEVYAEWFPGFVRRKSKAGVDEFDFAGLFFIDIPIPFKQGDILICDGQESEIFVLEHSGHDSPEYPEWYARSLRGEISDGFDMQSWAFFVDKAGTSYREHIGPYDGFEYYKDELKGKYRLLYYISLFIKDEIRLPDLLKMQCRILLEHLLDSHFKDGTNTNWALEHLLYENRKKTE